MAGNDNDFWDDMVLSSYGGAASTDHFLSEDEISGPKFTSLQDLTDRGRDKRGLPFPVNAGQRVSFVTNIGSVLSMDDLPTDGVDGTVVMVRTSNGDRTTIDDDVFVKWDDGKFHRVHRWFLRSASTSRKVAKGYRRYATSLGDLTDFMRRGGNDELIHKSTQDLWSFEESDEGVTINRLFDDTGEPLKG